MLKHTLTFVAVAAMLASVPSAHAGLLTSPIGLKRAFDASRTLTKIDARTPSDACMLHSDDVFAGPLTIWVC